MATPIGMNNPSTFDSMDVDKGLGLKGYDRSKIYFESLKYDVLTGNQNIIEFVETDTNGKNAKPVGDKYITKVTPNKDVGNAASSVVMEYVKAISGNAIEGNNAPYIGTEAVKDVMYTTAYANDYGRTIASFGFGVDKLEQDWWKLSDVDRKLLSQWIGETNGYYSRQALCEGISNNLKISPINRHLVLNPNSYLAGTGPIATGGDMGTYIGNFQGALSGVTGAHLDVPEIIKIADIASQDKYIQPIDINGKKLYGLLTAREEVRRLRSAGTGTNSYAEYYLQGSALARVTDVVPEAAMVIGDIIIIPDDRAPSIYAVTGVHYFGYVKQGRTSTRNNPDGSTPGTNDATFNVNILLGAGALLQYDRSMPDFKTQLDDYGRDVGTLIHACTGFVLPLWSDDNYTDESPYTGMPINEGSMLIVTSREETIGN